jgi:molecular chaperone GrpE
MTNVTNEQPRDGQAAADTQDVVTLQSELAKARDDMLRALAEVENTRRRAEKQAAEARAYGIDRFAADLLPVADTLSRAMQAAPRDGGDEALRNLIAGLELTERSLLDAFARHGLRRVGAKGDAFDPNLHQAVAQTPGDQPVGTLQEVIQPGYVLGERTLRAAMVCVSVGPGGAPPPQVDIKV